jgi:hypothetical protein
MLEASEADSILPHKSQVWNTQSEICSPRLPPPPFLSILNSMNRIMEKGEVSYRIRRLRLKAFDFIENHELGLNHKFH